MEWDWMAAHAPIATATIALIASIVAMRAIRVQRSIAKNRAAVDFFIKTEMDQPMLTAHAKYEAAALVLSSHTANSTLMAQFEASEEYTHVRSYLNIHELLAVGIRKGVIDEDVAYHFWADTLIRHCNECELLIKRLRQRPNHGAAYLELTNLHSIWKTRVENWHRQNPVTRMG
ncbi:hypothetical protein ACVIGA_000915 [Bradyrhizobium sp. USDA 3240]